MNTTKEMNFRTVNSLVVIASLFIGDAQRIHLLKVTLEGMYIYVYVYISIYGPSAHQYVCDMTSLTTSVFFGALQFKLF